MTVDLNIEESRVTQCCSRLLKKPVRLCSAALECFQQLLMGFHTPI